MRKFFYGLGILAATVAVAGAIGLFFLFKQGSALDAESKAYVDDSIIAISAHWSKDELLKRASPQLLANAKPQDLDALFDAATTGLGPLIEYRGATGQAVMMATTTSGATVSANYVAKARYQKGDATFRVSLIKVNGTWLIWGFFVDSTAMMSNLVGHRS